jgi:broad specificity phosphatase PhoE
MPATSKKIYLTRHGQAEHKYVCPPRCELFETNPQRDIRLGKYVLDHIVTGNSGLTELVRDAILTPTGREQCQELNKLSQKNYQKTAELIVSSPVCPIWLRDLYEDYRH